MDNIIAGVRLKWMLIIVPFSKLIFVLFSIEIHTINGKEFEWDNILIISRCPKW